MKFRATTNTDNSYLNSKPLQLCAEGKLPIESTTNSSPNVNEMDTSVQLERETLPNMNSLYEEPIPFAALVLRAFIVEKNLLQKYVAEASNMSESELSRYLSGRVRMKLRVVDQVARAIGESTEKIVKLSFKCYLNELRGQRNTYL